MKAVVYTRYGGSEVLEIKEIKKPIPKDNEVLIQVKAVCVNDFDFGMIQGDPFITRLGNGLFKPKKLNIPGSDISGYVVLIGKNITAFKVGDEVYGDLTGTWGGFAEYVCANESSIVLKPESMSFIEAAAIPQASVLAVQGLIQYGKIKTGQRLLINGAGGGVGTYGIQIAKTFNAEVTGVDSEDKFEMMRSLGFDHVIDYQTTDFTKTGQKYDLILDNKTNRSVFKYLKALNDGGTYVSTGGKIKFLLQTAIVSKVVMLISKKHLKIVILKPNQELDYMNNLYNKGLVKSIIDGPYDFDDAVEAFKVYEAGKQQGKIVIQMHN